MNPSASPPTKTWDISPLRSIVFLCLVISSLSITSISSLNASESVPDFMLIALQLIAIALYLSSIIGSILLIVTDKTEDRTAMTAHFLISAAISFVLCFSKFIERGGLKGFTSEDFGLCVNVVIWTVTCGMLSAIWIRGGVEGLKREAKAVPSNVWYFLYD